MKQIVLALAIAAAVLLVVVAFRGEDVASSSSSSPKESAAKPEAPPSTSPDVVLKITPGTGAVARSAAPKVRLDPAMQEWLEGRDLKSLYDRLSAGPRTPEQTWILAMILERCATFTDRKAQPMAQSAAEARARGRERFIASLSDKDPAREKRIAAYEQVTADKCAGLRDVKATGPQVKELVDAAAAAGDPKARLSVIQRGQRESLEARRATNPNALESISPATVDTLKEIVATRDPQALAAAFHSLTGVPYSDFSVRTGPDEVPVDAWLMSGAIRLAACDLGSPCGAESEYLQQMCAFNGNCDAHDFREYLFYYSASPYQSQKVAEYYAGLNRALYGGDWSYFTFQRGAQPSAAFSPEPPPKP
ncbi:MAG: hypothetical protein ACXWG6_03470 [Usitatibacter sp.]